MKRTTIVLPEHLHERLRCLASERRKSMAAYIREAVEEKLANEQPPLKSIGIFSSGGRNTGREAGEIKYEPLSWRS